VGIGPFLFLRIVKPNVVQQYTIAVEDAVTSEDDDQVKLRVVHHNLPCPWRRRPPKAGCVSKCYSAENNARFR